MKKLAIILLAMVTVVILYGCSKSDSQAKPANIPKDSRKVDSPTAIEKEIQAIKNKYAVGQKSKSNYIPQQKEIITKEEIKLQQEIYEVFVGKTFLTNTLYNYSIGAERDFFEAPKIGPHTFRLRSPEKFTVIRFLRELNHIDRMPVDLWYSAWYEVQFESGKKAFLPAQNFKYVTDPAVEVPWLRDGL
jgi:hypothetical protein